MKEIDQPSAIPAVSAVIVAAGSATRMKGIDKQLSMLDGMPVILRSILAFCRNEFISEVIVVAKEQDLALLYELVKPLDKVKKIVAGGETRQQSVFAGVACLSEKARYVAIHDGARPLVSDRVITTCVLDAFCYGAVAAAVAVKDTIKLVDLDKAIIETPDRSMLYQTQTPQIFRLELYRQAMEHAIREQLDLTDDCQLVEQIGHRVYVAAGDYNNIKITTQHDLAIAQALVEMNGWEGDGGK